MFRCGKNICKAELNGIVSHSIPIGWGMQNFLHGFYSETVYFKRLINIFECTEIVESIYEGVVEPSTKKLTNKYSNSSGHSSKIISR